LLHNALEKAGKSLRGKGNGVEEFEGGTQTLADVPTGQSPEGRSAHEKATQDEEQKLQQEKAAEESKIPKTANEVHDKIQKTLVHFRKAAKAQYFPNNTFRVGSGDFFVETASNNYIFPTHLAQDKFSYSLGSSVPTQVISQGRKKLKENFLEAAQDPVQEQKRKELQEAEAKLSRMLARNI
jgi:hypothetical protein